MSKYKVKIKHTEQEQIIKADSELEARVKFCEKNNLNYTHLASKLDIIIVSKDIKKEE